MKTIRYNHTSAETASSMTAALAAVRREMIHTQRTKHGANNMVTVSADDGTYCYLDQADADRDQTGASAFAVIS